MRYPTPALQRIKPLGNHDGDTVKVIVDRGGPNETREIWDIRLKDVFAPEVGQPGGHECQVFVARWLITHTDGSDWPFILETFRTPKSDALDMTFKRFVGIIRDQYSYSLNFAIQEYITENGWGGGIGG